MCPNDVGRMLVAMASDQGLAGLAQSHSRGGVAISRLFPRRHTSSPEMTDWWIIVQQKRDNLLFLVFLVVRCGSIMGISGACLRHLSKYAFDPSQSIPTLPAESLVSVNIHDCEWKKPRQQTQMINELTSNEPSLLFVLNLLIRGFLDSSYQNVIRIKRRVFAVCLI